MNSWLSSCLKALLRCISWSHNSSTCRRVCRAERASQVQRSTTGGFCQVALTSAQTFKQELPYKVQT